MKEKSQRKAKTIVEMENLEQLQVNAAGLDIGAEELYACVPVGRDTEKVRCFKSFSADLRELGAW